MLKPSGIVSVLTVALFLATLLTLINYVYPQCGFFASFAVIAFLLWNAFRSEPSEAFTVLEDADSEADASEPIVQFADLRLMEALAEPWSNRILIDRNLRHSSELRYLVRHGRRHFYYWKKVKGSRFRVYWQLRNL